MTDDEKLMIALFRETIATGCPPDTALKWWTYILRQGNCRPVKGVAAPPPAC